MTLDHRPILVTGVPRSGTTWLARLVATAPGTALTGREPMNPRGRQYALGGTLTGWTRLTDPTPRQRLALRATYRGLNPRTYGRYGRGQWRAPLPGVRVVVKDPFAMLSAPIIEELTGARTVQVFRHPGAVLASYRRMGWRADLAEISGLLADDDVNHGELVRSLWCSGPDSLSETEQMGVFWSVLSTVMLADLDRAPGTVLVSHHELATGGMAAAGSLFASLGLRTSAATEEEMASQSDRGRATGSADGGGGLHRLDRDPAEVAASWRRHLSPEDVSRIEEIAGPALARLTAARLVLAE
jgi:hypothetical protein